MTLDTCMQPADLAQEFFLYLRQYLELHLPKETKAGSHGLTCANLCKWANAFPEQ